ncbi:MAG: hypothetical protein WKF92_01255 [Pyrinomonadaceae bacterium]
MTGQIPVIYPAHDQEFVFRCYGVAVAVQCIDQELLLEAEQRLRAALMNRIEIIDNSFDISAKHCFKIGLYKGSYYYSGNGSERSWSSSKTVVLNFLESMVRLTVAEHAIDRVFIHSGVVARNGKAILIPGNSYSGKSTLIAELVKNGAVYYSDEYAILDENGLVHSFPRPLAMRGIEAEHSQTDVTVESLGGIAGYEPLPVGMVLITEFKEDAVWEPVTLEPGKGVLEIIPHTISIRFNTEFALGVLNKVVASASVIKSQRHDAKQFAKILSNLFDNSSNYVKMP